MPFYYFTMRLLNVILLSCIAIAPLAAKNVFMSMPGRNDTITKQIFPYHDPGAGGTEMIWNFRSIGAGDDYVVRNAQRNRTDSTAFVSDEHATRYYYKECLRELYCTGYENAVSYVQYDSMELRMNTDLQYGDTLSRTFSGSGEYAHRLSFLIEGDIYMKVDGKGALLLPEETVSPVIRVFTEKQHTRIMDDTVSLTTQIWQWYSPSYLYPIVETMRTLSEEDSVLFSATLVFAPQQQKEQNLRVDESYLNSTASHSIFTDASFLPNPVTSTLFVTYTLEEPAAIAFTLHYQGGILMYRCNASNQTEGVHYHEIPMSGMPTGAYTLYIHVNDVLISEPIIKQ